jgi:hypothetical protein
VDLESLRGGEQVSVYIVNIKQAQAVYAVNYIKSYVHHSRVLQTLFEHEDKNSITLRHPSGMSVKIEAVAAMKKGSTVGGTWLAGLLLDEAPRWESNASESAVNYEDTVSACMARLRSTNNPKYRSAAIFSIGSPWTRKGAVFNLYNEHFGKPNKNIVVCCARAQVMNPNEFTDEFCNGIKEQDPIAYQSDIMAQFIERTQGMFETDFLKKCTRLDGPLEIPPEAGGRYVAAIDAATRADVFALLIARLYPSGGIDVCFIKQWRGTSKNPLSLNQVFGEVKTYCGQYWLSSAWSDQFASDALRDIAINKGLQLMIENATSTSKVMQFDNLKALMQEGKVSLPNDPDLLADLGLIRRSSTQDAIKIDIPRTRTSTGQRHCDYAVCLALAASRPIGPTYYDLSSTSLGLSAHHHSGFVDWGYDGLTKW